MSENLNGKSIEIRVEQVSQLFDSLDPFPFHERDLDSDAEEYIVGWARELPRDRPLEILIHLPEAEARSQAARGLQPALARYFAYRVDVLGRDLKELFRVGRLSLLIGLAVLGLCLAIGQAITGLFGPSFVGRFVEEGFIIVGWVANWRPIAIFLYDWWPLARRRRLYQRLAAASVVVRSAG